MEGGGRRRRGGGGACSPETVKLETSDTQLGVQAGGWESALGDAVWVVIWGGRVGARDCADSPRETGGGRDLWYQGVTVGSVEH